MKIVAVRGDGPAAKQGVRSGDILVGLHKWETSDAFRRAQPIKFYTLRGGDSTMTGQPD